MRLYKSCLMLLLTLLLALSPALAEEEAPLLQVHQIEIGCADAYLFIHGDTVIMMDGGNDTGHTPDKLMEYLRAAGFGKLTAYIVTHYHDDHAANLNLILEEFGDENTIVYGPSSVINQAYDPLANGSYQQLRDGDSVTIGALKVKCVGPRELRQEGRMNADSLNVLITYGEHDMLFTGDFIWSNNVLDKYPDLLRDIEVFKFPHHGLEPYSIGPRALRQLNPDYILLPGSNSPVVLGFARQNGFTGELIDNGDGNTVLFSDGKEMMTVHTLCEPGKFADK